MAAPKPKSNSKALATKEMFLPTLPGTETYFGKTGLAPYQEPVNENVEVLSIAQNSKKTNLVVEMSYAEGKRIAKVTLADLANASDKNPNAQVVVNLSRPGYPLAEGDKYEVSKSFKFSRTKDGDNMTIAVSAAE